MSADTVTFTIDGKQATVSAGTLLVEAAKAAGVEIPVFCSHPKLDPLGACRMCLVEIETPRGNQLTTACTTPVQDGMVVHYNSETAIKARQATVEFILSNHPLDCPVCDKGGECLLQDTAMAHGAGESHFVEEKAHKDKHHLISDLIMLDQERCVVCWRCIRYLEEWEDRPRLELFQRGGETVVDTFPGRPVDAKTSGNIIDLCPVGALTSRVSRFQYRPWRLEHTNSICTHCSMGCNIRIDSRTHRVRRVVARENMAVNDEWICDKGRFVFGFTNHPERLQQPLIRKDDELQFASWEEALDLVAHRLSTIVGKAGADAIGGLSSTKLSNETAYLFQKLFRSLIGTNNIDHRDGGEVLADPRGLSSISDLRNLREDDAIVLVGMDPSEEQPVLDLFIKRAVRRQGVKLIVLHSRQIELARYGDGRHGTYLIYQPGSEVMLFNGLVRVILKQGWARENVARRFAGWTDLPGWVDDARPEAVQGLTGVPYNALRRAADMLSNAGRALIFYGPDVVRGPLAGDVAAALTNLALVIGQPDGLAYIGTGANSQGARDVGLLPDHLPGHASVTDAAVRDRLARLWGGELPAQPGLTYHGMLQAAQDGSLKGLYCLGADPASESAIAKAALEKLDFLVVQDLFLTETAKLADVVLPAASAMESSGTFTNLERRVQRALQAVRPVGDARPDWQILTRLAVKLHRLQLQDAERRTKAERRGKKAKKGGQRRASVPRVWSYSTPQSILEEITRAVPAYAGMGWDDLGDAGKQWSVQAVQQRPSFRPAYQRVLSSSGGYPLTLITGNLLYDGGTMFRTTKAVGGLIPQPEVWMNPQDARQMGLRAKQMITVASPSGRLRLAVRLDEQVWPGTIFVPRSLPGAPVETLLNGEGSTVRVRIEK
ncbi:MAG TPA: NADH dehydrogenase (quinone) subunit G [Anaerolineae bacterium]|nr:NADH dehydrogenase (quinone) subunit G [Anaerolineae bacterium]